MAQTSSTLHFASRSEADKYLVSNEIQVLRAKRPTRSRTQVLANLDTRLSALGAPIYKLPDDVLAEIFEVGKALAILTDDTSLGFAVTVSRVASRFRRVALATPRLWTQIQIRLEEGGRKRLELMAQRSASLPLRLELHMGTRYNRSLGLNHTNPAVDALADSLLSVSSRVDSLYIINWAGNRRWWGSNEMLFLTLLRACPLKHFSIWGGRTVAFPAPGFEAEELWNLLKEKTLLEALDLTDLKLATPQDRVQLTSVHSVTCCEYSFCTLLAAANLPNVSNITIDQTDLGRIWTPALKDLLRSAPPIRVLTLHRSYIYDLTTPVIIQLIIGLPSLFELHITDGHIEYEEPPKLTDWPLKTTPAAHHNPKLKVLRLNEPIFNDLYDAHSFVTALCELLLSGQNPNGSGPRLDLRDGTLDILGCPPIDAKTKAWLGKRVGILKCHSSIDGSAIRSDAEAGVSREAGSNRAEVDSDQDEEDVHIA